MRIRRVETRRVSMESKAPALNGNSKRRSIVEQRSRSTNLRAPNVSRARRLPWFHVAQNGLAVDARNSRVVPLGFSQRRVVWNSGIG